jgi:apolipoprotein N-acyltransferase
VRASRALPLHLLIAAASGLALALAFPPVGAWPLAIVAPAPLLWLASRARPRRGFLLGLVFGFVCFGVTLTWISLFGQAAWFALTLLSALWIAVFGALAPAVVREGRPLVSALGLAALWTALDFARGAWPLGGFTWGSLGVSQVDNRVTLRLASLGGVWLVTFAVVGGAALLAAATGDRGASRQRRAALVGLAAAVLLAPAAIPFPAAHGRAVDVAATVVDVRPYRSLSGGEEDRAVATEVLRVHRTIAQGRTPELVVWGESALDPGAATTSFIGDVRQAIAEVGVPVLAGSIQPGAAPEELHNTVLAFDGSGTEVGRYEKTHLVPFGEYVPFRSRLDWFSALDQIPYDLTPGDGLHTLRVPGLPRFATPVCFENAFASLDRALVRQGAEFLVVVTNNASYELTAASAQHLQLSRIRAVEDGRWVVHAGITGISAFVDPTGEVKASRGLFDTGIVRGTIRSSREITPYVRFGDWAAWASVGLATGLFLMPRPRRKARAAPAPMDLGARVLVILPTYDERPTIERVLEGVLAAGPTVQALVVDDGSPDRTAAAVREVMAAEPRVRLIERSRKSGLASAYLEGFATALAEGHDLVVEMDSDLSHDPQQLPGLLAAARDGADLAIGSRYVPGGSVSNWSRARVALSRGGNVYARLSLGMPINDSTSGFRAYRRDLLARLVAQGVHSDGYGFQVELALRAYRDGWTLREIPITFREREHGRSKISRRIVVEALWLIARWGVRLRLGREV